MLFKLEKRYWFAIISKILVVSISLLVSIFINRGLGVELKGEYTYIINLVELLYIILCFSLGQTYSTFKKKMGEKIDTTFVILTLAHSITVLIAGLIIVQFVNADNGYAIVILTALSIANMNFSMLAVIKDSVKRNAIVTVSNIVYLLLLVLLFVIDRFSLTNVLICYGINELINISAFIKEYKLFSFKQPMLKSEIKNIYSTALITTVAVLLISINYKVDTLMLRNMAGKYNLGLYSVAVNFSSMYLMIPDAFKEVIFGDSTAKDFSKKTALNAIRVSFIVAGIIVIGFAVFGKFAIKLLYGVDYVPSYATTLILFIGSISMIFFKILQPIYIADGKQKKAVVFLACSGVFNIVANYFLIPIYAHNGAAIASAISYTVCGLLFMLDYMKEK